MKNYDGDKAVEFLEIQKVPHEICLKIRNLFDRRNKSPVSHADPIAWAVTESEYDDYRTQVGECLKHLTLIWRK